MEWFNRRDGILTNVCGYTIWCFHENMTFSNNWVNCCLITLQLQVLHSFDKPFYVNEFPTKMNHVAFFSSTKTNTKMELFSQLVKQHDFGYCTFLELTKFGGRKPSFPRVCGLEGLCMGLLQIQTYRRKDSATTSGHLAEDVEGFHPTVKRLGKWKKTPRESHSFFEKPKGF